MQLVSCKKTLYKSSYDQKSSGCIESKEYKILTDDWLGYGSSGDEDVKESDYDEDLMMPKVARLIKRMKFKQAPCSNIQFAVGQMFNNVTHFRDVLVNYAIQEGFQLNRVKNDKSRVTLEWKDEKFP